MRHVSMLEVRRAAIDTSHDVVWSATNRATNRAAPRPDRVASRAAPEGITDGAVGADVERESEAASAGRGVVAVLPHHS